MEAREVVAVVRELEASAFSDGRNIDYASLLLHLWLLDQHILETEFGFTGLFLLPVAFPNIFIVAPGLIVPELVNLSVELSGVGGYDFFLLPVTFLFGSLHPSLSVQLTRSVTVFLDTDTVQHLFVEISSSVNSTNRSKLTGALTPLVEDWLALSLVKHRNGTVTFDAMLVVVGDSVCPTNWLVRVFLALSLTLVFLVLIVTTSTVAFLDNTSTVEFTFIDISLTVNSTNWKVVL